MKVENRNKKWYGKYIYRAKFNLAGVSRTYNTRTFLDFLKRLDNLLSNTSHNSWQTPWNKWLEDELVKIDLDTIERYIIWRNKNAGVGNEVLLRNEGDRVSAFGNDLTVLETIVSIDPSMKIEYSEVDVNIPNGVKYFVKEPKHKYRLYLKPSRLSDKPTFREDLQEFLDRYKNTSTIIVPSRALKEWLYGPTSRWKLMYCQGHYYVEYDDESTHMLLSLMFDGMVASLYKLEKRPQ